MPLSAFVSTDTTSPVAIHIVVKGASASSSSAATEATERPTPAVSASSLDGTNTFREETPGRKAIAASSVAPAALTEAVPAPPASSAPAAAAPPAPAIVHAPVPQDSVHVPLAQTEEPATSDSKQQDDPRPTPPHAGAAPASSFTPGMGTYYSNQMAYGVAYQAAYQAALQAVIAAQQHQQQPNNGNGSPPEGGASDANQPLPPGPGQQMVYPMLMLMPCAQAMPYYNYPYYPYNSSAMMHHLPPQHPMQGQVPSNGGGQGMAMRQRRQAAVVAAVAGGPDGRVPEDLLRRLRELRNRGFQLPNELVVALDREEARLAGGARPPRVHRFQFRIQINIRALLQIAVLLVVVYQNCPPKRFAVLCLLGFALWLSTTPRVRAFLQTIAGLGPNNNNNNNRGAGGEGEQPVPARGPGPQAVAADGQPPAAPAVPPDAAVQPAVDNAAALHNTPPLDPQLPDQQHQQLNNAHRGGFLHEIQAFVAGFITSLLPAMDRQHNNDDDDGNAAGGGGVFGGEQ